MSLLDDLRRQIEKLDEQYSTHLQRLNELEAELKPLRQVVRDLEEARELRRWVIARRWSLRRDLREAKTLIRDAKPLSLLEKGFAFQLRLKGRTREQLKRKVTELAAEWHAQAASVNQMAGGAGIYALWNETRLIYIGQSVRLASRVCEHFGAKKFTHASFINVAPERLDSVERLLIDVFLPPLNMDSTTMAIKRRVEKEEKAERQREAEALLGELRRS